MVAATYAAVRVADPASADVAPRKGFWARFMAALMEARQKQAHREINMHMALSGYGFDPRTDRLVKIQPEAWCGDQRRQQSVGSAIGVGEK